MRVVMIRGLFWVLAPVVLFSGCGQSESEEPTTVGPFDGGALTADYFHGNWCLRSVGLLGQGTEPDVPYVFREDGSLQFQTGPGAPVQNGGVWRVEGDRVYLEARPLLGDLTVLERSRNHFVIDFTVQYRFERGGCG